MSEPLQCETYAKLPNVDRKENAACKISKPLYGVTTSRVKRMGRAHSRFLRRGARGGMGEGGYFLG